MSVAPCCTLNNSKIRLDSQITLHQRHLTFIGFQLCKVGNRISSLGLTSRPSACLSYVMAVLSDCVISGARKLKFSLSVEIWYALRVCNRLCWQFPECFCHEIKLIVEWMLHDLSTLASRDEWSERNKNMTERETKNPSGERLQNLIGQVSEKRQSNYCWMN